MSDDNWISAKEAHRRAKAAGATGDDLLEWARLGKLRASAKSGIFSSDFTSEMDNARECERIFPVSPPADEDTRAALGPWPDVPVDFWAVKPTKATWAAGTFASRVYYWCDYHQARMDEHIELFEVAFHTGDLIGLLSEPVPVTKKAPLRGVLPSNATPGQRRYEEAAHRAAEILRSERGFVSVALRQALEETKAVEEGVWETRQRQLRAVYQTMYTEEGRAIQNDPD